jgi:hypothetical protein
MKKVLFLMITSAALFTACKKDKEKTTAEKVQAKWTLNVIAANDFYNNTAHPFNFNGLAGDYIDFRTDNKAYERIGGSLDTVGYSISSDSKIVYDGDTYDIKTLTENQFIIYNKTTSTTSNNYDETTYTLSK